MAASDATAIPVKNQAYRVTFPILDADGDLVTGATGLDSEVSKDGGAFADATSEATEIATASGMYYLDLTATEMNADTVAIIVKTTSSGAKTTPIVLYPRETGDILVKLEPITHTSAVIPTVSTLTGHTAQTGDAFARLGAPAGASVSADVAAVKADTAAVKTKTDYLPSATAGAAGGVFIAGANAATSVTTALTANVTGNLSGSVGSVTGAVGSVTAGVTLATAAVQAIWDALTSALVTTGSIGKKLADWVIGTSQTGDAFARLGAPAGASVSADVAAVKADTAAVLVDTGTTLDGRIPAALVSGRMDASVGAMAANVVTAAAIADGAIDRATFAADTGLQAIRSGTAQAGAAGSLTLDAGASASADFYKDAWIYLTGGLGAGQVNRITAYSGSSKVATVVKVWIVTPDATTTFAIFGSGTVNTDAVGTNAITAASIATDAIGAVELAATAVNEIADQVWDEILSGHLGAGSTGLALNSAGAAGDPWSTALPGAYGAGTAGKIIGDNVNAPIATVDTVVDAIKAKTDNLPSDPADESLIIAATGAISSAVAGVQADTDALQAQFNGMTEDDGAVRRFTANALEQAPGGAGGNPNLLLDTTIATAPSQVSFTLTNGPTDNDGLMNQAVVFYDASSGNAPSVRLCTDYVASSKTITIDSAPDFTVIAGDGIKFFVTAPGTTAPTTGQISQAVCDELASTKRTISRLTGDVKHYRLDGTTVRGTLRPTEIDANTQGLVPQ